MSLTWPTVYTVYISVSEVERPSESETEKETRQAKILTQTEITHSTGGV